MASSDRGDVQERARRRHGRRGRARGRGTRTPSPASTSVSMKRVVAARPPRSERAPDAAVGAAQHQALEVVFRGRPLQRRPSRARAPACSSPAAPAAGVFGSCTTSRSDAARAMPAGVFGDEAVVEGPARFGGRCRRIAPAGPADVRLAASARHGRHGAGRIARQHHAGHACRRPRPAARRRAASSSGRPAPCPRRRRDTAGSRAAPPRRWAPSAARRRRRRETPRRPTPVAAGGTPGRSTTTHDADAAGRPRRQIACPRPRRGCDRRTGSAARPGADRDAASGRRRSTSGAAVTMRKASTCAGSSASCCSWSRCSSAVRARCAASSMPPAARRSRSPAR